MTCVYAKYFQLHMWCINCLIHIQNVKHVGTILDVSKIFIKVWDQKLKSMGISGSLLRLLNFFKKNEFQKVLLNGHTSDWLPVDCGEPQESILGLLTLLI